MKKFILSFLTIFCAALIAVSIFQMKNTTYESDAGTRTAYIVKEYGGKVAVFTPREDEPLTVYEIYVHLLPENDVELLRKGIRVKNDYYLQKTLEDLGL